MHTHRVRRPRASLPTMIVTVVLILATAAAVFGMGLVAISRPTVPGRPSPITGYRDDAQCLARVERANAHRWDPARGFTVDHCARLDPSPVVQPGGYVS